MHSFNGLCVHPRHGLMFWTLWAPGGESRIEMAHMDGEQRQILVNKNNNWLSGLAIDYITNKLFFGDAQLGMIEKIDIFTHKREIVINYGTHYPFDLLIFDQQLFWTDWHNKTLVSVSLRNVNESQRTLLTSFDEFPLSVTINHPAYQDPNIENPCLHAGCSHICVLKHIDPKSEKPTATCLCPSGYRGFDSAVTNNSRDTNQTQCVPVEDGNVNQATFPKMCYETFVSLCSSGEACGKGSCCLVEKHIFSRWKKIGCSCPEGLTGVYCEIDERQFNL